MNGYNFTERVRRVLANSRTAAVNLHHQYVGTEHILIGIAEESEGVSAAVLEHLGADRDAILARVKEVVSPGGHTSVGPRGQMLTSPPQSDLPYTSRGKKVLELSMAEARMLHHSYVGTEHLLLGLIAEDKGIGAQILKDAGVTLERAREQTRAILGTEVSRPTPPDTPGAHPTSPGYARSRSPYGVALVDDFTGRARDALRAAYAEAQARGHGAVELSHVLLALASREDGMAAVLLDQVVGSRKRVVEALVERLPDKEEGASRRTLQISPETQQALDNALIEASKDGHRRAGTQHLLLAVLDVLPLALAAACAQLGLTPKATRTVYDRMRE
jgi:ATP-dependent Clp protease ATP-binding subunit ClpC